VAAILGLLVATAFWLACFDFFSIRGERMLHDLDGAERVALARDVYAYAHFPMIVGIVLLLVLPLATAVPALAALALVTVVWLALHTYELVRWREARAESRSMLASS
jgi:low temperature requirement protein LtrA